MFHTTAMMIRASYTDSLITMIRAGIVRQDLQSRVILGMKNLCLASKFYRNILALTLSLGVSGCITGSIPVTVNVPPLPARADARGGKIPGRYAVILSSGTWNSHPTGSGECSAYTFNLDPNPIFNAALKDLVTKSLQSADFFVLTAESPKPDLKGYDAIIVATLSVGKQSVFFQGFHTSASVSIKLLLAIASKGANKFSQELAASSRDPGGRFLLCSEASEYVGNAMQHALIDELDQIDRVLHSQLGSPAR